MNYIVESAVREYALACSKANRAGKFQRVSEIFLNDLDIAIECALRQLESKIPESLHPLPPCDSRLLVASAVGEAAVKRLEGAIRKLIANRVQATPSKGQTL